VRLAVALALLAAPAAAQDAEALGSCLERVGEAQGATGERLFDGRACLGTVEFLCSEMGEGDCVAKEEAAWQALAGEALRTLADAAVDADTAEALLERQSGWEAWVVEDCALVAPFTDDPSLIGFAAAYCLRDAWAERAITLRTRVDSVF
jgi:uncharacterized protein YecT (DUF1311 family)